MTAAIAAALHAFPGGGWLDSYAVADALYAERSRRSASAESRQTCDYVQYLLRESAHVCRHADGHFYRLHAEVECSAECNRLWAIAAPVDEPLRPPCPHCFLAVPTCGVCDCQD